VTGRLDTLVRALPSLALLAFLVLAGWLAAQWFWYFATPTESPAAPARNRVLLSAAAQTVADAHLFGVVPSGTAAVISNLNIKLKGVFASTSDAPAYAIVNTGTKDETARAGGELVPGVVLEAIHPEHVVLRRNGALERINLEERVLAAGAVAVPRAPARQRSVAAPVAAPSPPAARFQRPEPHAPVGDVGTAPQPPPAPLVAAPPQVAAPAPPAPPVAAPAPPGAAAPGLAQVQSSGRGLVIQAIPPGSALERLGLQPGDVVRSVNGEAVTNEADIARIMQQRGIQGSYTAEVMRGGMTIPLVVGGGR
jgi:general secretion pathway protein C